MKNKYYNTQTIPGADWCAGGCETMGSNSLSKLEELFFDLKNFFGLETDSELGFIIGAFRMDVKDAYPHLPTIPADLVAETPEKNENIRIIFLSKRIRISEIRIDESTIFPTKY